MFGSRGTATPPWRAGKAIDEVGTAPSDITATTDPTVTDDGNAGHSKGLRWLNTSTNEIFECASATNGAAVWTSLSAQGAVTEVRVSTFPDIDPSGSNTDSLAIGDNAGTGTANTAVVFGKDAKVADGSTGSVSIGLYGGQSGGGASGGNYNVFAGANAARAVVGTATFGGSNLVMGAYSSMRPDPATSPLAPAA